MSTSTILSGLNKQQQEAVHATDGPVIILAGAGSGKTRVLVHRVLYLILEKHVAPENILMVTFTNKAAAEMKERISSYLTTGDIHIYSLPFVGTFHSLCAKILRRDGYHIGIPIDFQIFDEIDQMDAIKQTFELTNMSPKELRPRSALSSISQAKNEMLTPEMYASIARGYYQEKIALIYPVYQQILRDAHALDFDDLLLEMIRLLKESERTRDKYQELFKYILIDECQDTNRAQYEITKLLGGKYSNICIVGDFSQSIYSFRGADYRNLNRFKKDFPHSKTFSLSQNYRSTQNILTAATSVITHNTSHPVLELWTENPEGEKISLFAAENEHHEVELIIQTIIQQQQKDPAFSLSDVAILYRMNAQSRSIEEVLLHHGIPYVLVGGVHFYERREIKDVLSLISLLSNPANSVARRRIEKLGKRRFEKYLAFIEEFRSAKKQETYTTIDILDSAIKAYDYLSLFDENNSEDKARLENIAELRSVALEFPTLVSFLENVALVESEHMPDRGRIDRKNAIALMTLHAAKGLEFRMVFLAGMEEGIFPHSQAFLQTSEVEEERRLCYVGITRAKEKLFLSFAKRRLIFGQRSMGTVSRFILEIPKQVLHSSIDFDDSPDFL